MTLKEFIIALLDDIATSVVAALIYYAFTKSINGTYIFALCFCIGCILLTTIKTIALVKMQPETNSKSEDDSDNNEI